MDEIPTYNLLQVVDPTKIKVAVSERFAKLTLSSNKKQQERGELDQEKRDSVSRNIFEKFVDENKENKPNLVKNPLLRSESSKETESNISVCATELTMESLQLSADGDNPTQMEDDLELLSQRIASMAVEHEGISLLSSDSTDNGSVLSSDDKSSSANGANNIHILHNIPINVRELVNRETIYLNLSSTTENECEKNPGITDDEDEEEVEAITISDSCESCQEKEQSIMTTSSLPSNALTSVNLSPPNLKTNKAERVAAFLRDVSMEQRAMVDQGQIIFHDTLDEILDNKERNKTQEALQKSRYIATADTESMTPDENEEEIPISCLERERRLKDLEEPTENKQIMERKSNIESKNDFNVPDSSNSAKLDDGNIYRLAKHETVEDTVVSREEKTNVNYNCETPKCSKKNLHKFANDETQSNTEYSINEETPKFLSGTKSNQDNSRRLLSLVSEGNTECCPTKNTLSSKTHRDPRRAASEEPLFNSLMSDFKASLTEEPLKKKTNEECEGYISTSIQSSSNSSYEINNTPPKHSITISETDEENVEYETSEENENSNHQKLSTSFCADDSNDNTEFNGKLSQIQMSMGNINISAKINIKIHIPIAASMERSEDDQTDSSNNQDKKKESKQSSELSDSLPKSDEQEDMVSNDKRSVDSNVQSMDLESQHKPYRQTQLKSNLENHPSPRMSSDSEETVENEKFLTESEKILNKLYGKSWQTPDIVRSLRRTCQSSVKKLNNPKAISTNNVDVNNSIKKNYNKKSTVEKSMLDDFAIFRSNIVKTSLDSTRLASPKSSMQYKPFSPEASVGKSAMQREKMNEKPISKTERKPVVTNRGRVVSNRWRQIIDSDSEEGGNASDDDDADESWSRNASEIDDSDYKNSPTHKPKRKQKTLRHQERKNKSDYLKEVLNKSKAGEVVYLDLSKEEVEVQEEVPKSPPANHDATFADHLQDILKSCRHENKNKLPSSNMKTKRKLFTPHLGDDDFEEYSTKDDTHQAIDHTDMKSKANINDDGILEDNGISPFDSQGRPKVFDLVNKKLESFKTAKPVFLTPPSKTKAPPKSVEITNKNARIGNAVIPNKNSNNEGSSKKTVKTDAKKTLSELLKIPDFKYSFLKSLETTVGKTFCHPNALYYRDNYRQKKDDLSKILYDIYNEKLFGNELDVAIRWNKKLINTAGRCLNKKKLGVRSSVIELSDKVLTSADRLRCTLIHELCHAATWIFNGEGGHGTCWKEWARRANHIFPEIPKIGVCHQYDIEYKYTYKCTLCEAKSHAHSKSKKVENIRCSYCHGAIEVFLNKKDKYGNVMPTPVKEPTGFAKFVKDNYKKFKRDDLKHTDVMKLLSSEFASLKVACNP